MTEELMLESQKWGSLILATIIYDKTYFIAKAYVALRAAPDGTIYHARNLDGTISYVRAEQQIFEGAWFYPGDPKHYSQLLEAPLFRNMGGSHGR